MTLRIMIWWAFLLGTIGAATGTSLAFLIRPGRKLVSLVLEFASGLMLAVACFGLIPRAFAFGQLTLSFIGLILGIVFSVAVQFLIHCIPQKWSDKTQLKTTGVMIAILYAVLNFVEGFALGAGFRALFSLGTPIFIAIVFRNLSQAGLITLSLRFGGGGKFSIFLFNIILGSFVGAGLFCGTLIGGACPNMIAAVVSFSGGAILYVAEGELISTSRRLYPGRGAGFFNVCGILTGVSLLFII